MQNSEQEILLELERLKSIKGENNWKDVRDIGNYNVVEKSFSFGIRSTLVPKGSENKEYVDLQSSRSIGIRDGMSIDELNQEVDLSLEIKESDQIRIDEIDKIIRSLDIDPRDVFDDSFCFAELGYRVPKLMNYYQKRYDAKVFGYDVVPLSFFVSKKLGFDGRIYDFNKIENPIDLTGAKLVVSYHMLEHLSDPSRAIKKIYESLDAGAFFHVEVPVETGIPRVEFGHLFPFHDNDLFFMLIESGFKVLTKSNQTHTGGSKIERYMARK